MANYRLHQETCGVATGSSLFLWRHCNWVGHCFLIAGVYNKLGAIIGVPPPSQLTDSDREGPNEVYLYIRDSEVSYSGHDGHTSNLTVPFLERRVLLSGLSPARLNYACRYLDSKTIPCTGWHAMKLGPHFWSIPNLRNLWDMYIRNEFLS